MTDSGTKALSDRRRGLLNVGASLAVSHLNYVHVVTYTKNGEHMCLYFVAKKRVNFTIFNRDRLEDTGELFERTNYPDRGTLKIKEGTEPDFDLLTRLVRQSASQHTRAVLLPLQLQSSLSLRR